MPKGRTSRPRSLINFRGSELFGRALSTEINSENVELRI